MTDLATDHDSAVELLGVSYGRLSAVDPQNPLLRFVTRESGVDIEALSGKYKPPNLTSLAGRVPIAYVLSHYATDLMREYERKIRDEKKRTGIDLTPIDSLDSIGEVPF